MDQVTSNVNERIPTRFNLEKQMHEDEENLLKKWDTTTVKHRQENSLSIRRLSLESDDKGTSVRTKRNSTTEAPSVLSQPGTFVRFEFPDVDIVSRQDTSFDDETEIVEDDSRRFSYTECPITGTRMMRMELDIDGFQPKDITVKSRSGRLMVHGISHELLDGKKSTNEFCRKIKLPQDVTSEKLKCTVSKNVLVVEAPVSVRSRSECGSSPIVNGVVVGGVKHLNFPQILSDENGGRYLDLTVDLGSIFKPSDVVVKVRSPQMISIIAESEENTKFSRMKAKVEREFDLPEKIDQKSLRAGYTEDRLLKVKARIKDSKEENIINISN